MSRAAWHRNMVQLSGDERDRVRELVAAVGIRKAAKLLASSDDTVEAMTDPYGAVEEATRDRVMARLEIVLAGGTVTS